MQHIDSIVNLAVMYETGKGVAVDLGRAVELLSQAADLGDRDARRDAGRLVAALNQEGRQAHEEGGSSPAPLSGRFPVESQAPEPEPELEPHSGSGGGATTHLGGGARRPPGCRLS